MNAKHSDFIIILNSANTDGKRRREVGKLHESRSTVLLGGNRLIDVP